MWNKFLTICILNLVIFSSCKKREDDLITPNKEESKHSHHSAAHVCVEKFITPVQERTEAAIYTSTQWKAGQTIRIKFLNGDAALQTKVKEAAKTWLTYANLKFLFVTQADQADIRIGFKFRDDLGSWSYYGTDCQYITDQNEPTMNFGWFDATTSNEEIQRTTLHEFGHALGLLHEQSSPGANIPWNKEAVYNYYTSAPNYWTKEAVDNNVFYKFSSTQSNYTTFDKYSIMQYSVPSAFTTDGSSIETNSRLSDADKYFMGQRYPFPATVKTVLYSGQVLLKGEFLNSPDKSLKMILQQDGNFVLYNANKQPLWASRTGGKTSIAKVTMQSNGDLVLSDNAYKNYWQSYTYHKGSIFKVENDGSASIYLNGNKVWSTKTKV